MTAHYRGFPRKRASAEVAKVDLTFLDVQLYRDVGKRGLDLFLVLLMLPVWLPFVVLLAACVSLDGHSPFYSQKRVGRSGRLFTMWKLRTMVPDADRRLADYLESNPDAAKEWSHKQKLSHDPRITRLGRFLRRSSLDEFPQLFNVLIGDMSLVGPRPMMPQQVKLYNGQAYYRLRPGVTGFWQISDRNACSFASRATYDAQYLRSVSLRTDVSVIAATFQVMLKGTGC